MDLNVKLGLKIYRNAFFGRFRQYIQKLRHSCPLCLILNVLESLKEYLKVGRIYFGNYKLFPTEFRDALG